jgi:hypothetical protein
MKDAVRDAIRAFQTQFEAAVRVMYCDVKGLLTTGIGNRLFTVADALALTWLRPGTIQIATPDEVRAEYDQVQQFRPSAAQNAGRGLELSMTSLDSLFWGRAFGNDLELARRFDGYDGWCADAQLGAHAVAWAAGSDFAFPKLEAALRADPPDFATAAGPASLGVVNDDAYHLMTDAGVWWSLRGEAWMENDHRSGPNPSNPGLHPRNLATRILFGNAAVIHSLPGFDFEHLSYPQDLRARFGG